MPEFRWQDIEKTIRELIETKILPGDKPATGDHLCRVTLDIHEIKFPRRENNLWIVECFYKKIIETEFTIYPDNPPYESSYHSIYEISEDGTISERISDTQNK